jgi:GcrA cell cycle regulator
MGASARETAREQLAILVCRNFRIGLRRTFCSGRVHFIRQSSSRRCGKILRMSLTYPENQQHNSLNTPWTAERDEMLKRLWADGYSASLIADQLANGRELTRCAVIGRVHRLKLPRRKQPPLQHKPYRRVNGKPPRRPQPPPSPPPLRPSVLRPAAPVPSPPPAPDMRKLPLLQLEPHHCRFPEGDGPFLFCGADTHEGKVYCDFHHEMSRAKKVWRV